MRDTSIQAYNKILLSLNDRQQKVFNILERSTRPMCSYEIANALGWPINCVTPRINELEKIGVIIDMGIKMSPTGYKAHYWKVNNDKLF